MEHAPYGPLDIEEKIISGKLWNVGLEENAECKMDRRAIEWNDVGKDRREKKIINPRKKSQLVGIICQDEIALVET